jgi:predicted O-linked N-acetylglucosamine transferase (SPINDLY family)
MTDREVAQLSRELGIEVAIDLKGLTQDSRPGIFAERASDLQLNYLGYPGTMGAGFIDYLIADPILIPEASRQNYTEKIVYLPDSYQVNDSTRATADGSCSRADAGLPENGFIFCCFNINWKITPRIFDLWMRILQRVDGSLLWLLQDNAEVVGNLRQEASNRGVDPDRLVFAQRLPSDRHLARHRLADLFLDTFPCNAHTTASDALWTGVPVLTWAGESFAGRVGASLLNAVGLSELITTSEADYEELAVELALLPQRLRGLNEKLARNRLTTPLFDTVVFTRHLEAAYVAMLERQHAGLPPDHLKIEPLVL